MSDVFGGHFVGEVVRNKVLTVYAGQNKFGHHLWKWSCPHCLIERGPSTISHLSRGIRCNSCSLNDRTTNPRWRGVGDLPGVYVSQARAGALRRGLAWELTAQDLWEKFLEQQGRCAYTGWELSFAYKTETTASLDRINNADGYVSGNVQWVHKLVNRMKSNFTEAEFLALCHGVASHTSVDYQQVLKDVRNQTEVGFADEEL